MVIAEKAQHLSHLEQTWRRLQQTVSHLIRHDRRRLQGILRVPLLSSSRTLVGPWMQRLDDYREDLDYTVQTMLQQKRVQLNSKKIEAQALNPQAQIRHFKQKLIQYDKALSTSILSKIRHARHLFDPTFHQKQIDRFWTRFYHLRDERLKKLAGTLNAIDPKNLLRKGYNILFSEKDRSVITSIQALQENASVRIMLSDGEALATINEIYRHE
jgi:exodeoxyribonuclease VII large subunit